MSDAKLLVKLYVSFNRARDCVHYPLAVFRMNLFDDFSAPSAEVARRNPEEAMLTLVPQQAIGCDVPVPGTDFGAVQGQSQPRLVVPQCDPGLFVRADILAENDDMVLFRTEGRNPDRHVQAL